MPGHQQSRCFCKGWLSLLTWGRDTCYEPGSLKEIPQGRRKTILYVKFHSMQIFEGIFTGQMQVKQYGLNQVINSYFPSLNSSVLSWALTFVPDVWVDHLIINSQIHLVSLSLANGGTVRSKMSTNSVKQLHVQTNKLFWGNIFQKPSQEEARMPAEGRVSRVRTWLVFLNLLRLPSPASLPPAWLTAPSGGFFNQIVNMTLDPLEETISAP